MKLYVKSEISLQNLANVKLLLAKSPKEKNDKFIIQWSWAGHKDIDMINNLITPNIRNRAVVRILKKAVRVGYMQESDLPKALKNNKVEIEYYNKHQNNRCAIFVFIAISTLSLLYYMYYYTKIF